MSYLDIIPIPKSNAPDLDIIPMMDAAQENFPVVSGNPNPGAIPYGRAQEYGSRYTTEQLNPTNTFDERFGQWEVDVNPVVTDELISRPATPKPSKPDNFIGVEAMAGQQSAGAGLEKIFGKPPPAVRAFATTLVGDRSKIDESFFTNEELEILRDTAERSIAEGKKEIGYGDYNKEHPRGWEKSFIPGGTESVLHALTDLPSSLSFTLGMAQINKEDDGTIVIKDKYDFAASKKQVQDLKDQGTWAILNMMGRGFIENGLLGPLNVIGNLAAPEEGGRDVEIRIPKKK